MQKNQITHYAKYKYLMLLIRFSNHNDRQNDINLRNLREYANLIYMLGCVYLKNIFLAFSYFRQVILLHISVFGQKGDYTRFYMHIHGSCVFNYPALCECLRCISVLQACRLLEFHSFAGPFSFTITHLPSPRENAVQIKFNLKIVCSIILHHVRGGRWKYRVEKLAAVSPPTCM